jgi:hypothetical protein
VFERAASFRPQNGVITESNEVHNAWDSAKGIWSTSKSRFEASNESGMKKRTPRKAAPRVFSNKISASTLRQGSLSDFDQTKQGPVPLMSEADQESLQSKLSWGSTPLPSGLSTKPRIQTLSPTRFRHDQALEVVTTDHNGTRKESLLNGSAPDVEEATQAPHQSSQLRQGPYHGSRTLVSPTKLSSLGSRQQELSAQVLNANTFRINASQADTEKFQLAPSHFANGPALSGRNMPFIHNDQGPGDMTTYDPPMLSQYRQSDRSLHGQLVPQSRAAVANFDETIKALEGLNFGHITDSVSPSHPFDNGFYPRFRNGQSLSGSVSQLNASPQSPEDEMQLVSAQFSQPTSRLNPQAPPHHSSVHHASRGMSNMAFNDFRTQFNGSYCSTNGTPPTGSQSVRSTPRSGISSRTSHYDPFLLDHQPDDADQYEYGQSMYGPRYGHLLPEAGYQYDIQSSHQISQINPFTHPYYPQDHLPTDQYPIGPRVHPGEVEQPHVVRSFLLEEFRINGKTNRRFELKDIYGHVVEFSGDQHGSRFIQQKLETANSDEKDQIFDEIQDNVLQLMTDVFGNYVIQKMFEHGSQAQKKILAGHMRNHVLHLSMQMYGCRVVQKAFEHVLLDQQASLVKELDGPNLQILKVVKDSNGNHVVQKAIERIPGKHIQFIVDAHRGQMAKMSTHQYGCRVIQRMLEHCEPPTKRIVLDELLDHILPLVSDSFGNYVVQHIIVNGEAQDKRQVVDVILQQLLPFSKHKFASNIVEKSLDCADLDQRQHILRGLTAPDEQGVTPVLGLMRDQYGNYVLRKFKGTLSSIQRY